MILTPTSNQGSPKRGQFLMWCLLVGYEVFSLRYFYKILYNTKMHCFSLRIDFRLNNFG